MNGFFKGNVTPYTVGSVIPNNEVTVEEIPNARSFVSFVRNATAKAAPPVPRWLEEALASIHQTHIVRYSKT